MLHNPRLSCTAAVKVKVRPAWQARPPRDPVPCPDSEQLLPRLLISPLLVACRQTGPNLQSSHPVMSAHAEPIINLVSAPLSGSVLPCRPRQATLTQQPQGVPHLLASTSADGALRLWDSRGLACSSKPQVLSINLQHRVQWGARQL